MTTTPILLIAFNRPKTLQKQLNRIDRLSKRNVVISLEKSIDKFSSATDETKRVAHNWQSHTGHKVSIIERKSHLGIYEHMPLALYEFFSKFERGLILEDDIEFVPNFVGLLDLTPAWLRWGDYWSICGHNPLANLNPYSYKMKKFSFRPSRFHSVWGWATTSKNASLFARSYDQRLANNEVRDVLETVSLKFTRDPFLRKAFLNSWTTKMLGWNRRRPQGGWDTRWVFEAWIQGQLSLIPDNSLSREEINQNEGQTHNHTNEGVDWPIIQGNQLYFDLQNSNKRRDIALLRTWGVSRPYGWLYARRISQQLIEANRD